MSVEISVNTDVRVVDLTVTFDGNSVTLQPVITIGGGGGAVKSVTGNLIDNTDPLNPVANAASAISSDANNAAVLGSDSKVFVAENSPTNGGDFTGAISLNNLSGTYYNEYNLETQGSLTFSIVSGSAIFGSAYVMIYSDGITELCSEMNLKEIFDEQNGIPASRILPVGKYPFYFWRKPEGNAILASSKQILPITDIDLNTELGSKLLIWLKDSTDTANLIQDGTNASAWLDSKTGGSNNAVQATLSKQPTLNANGLLFDGVDDLMRITGLAIGNFEIFFILNQVSYGSNDRIIDFEGSARIMIQQSSTVSGFIRLFSFINSSLVQVSTNLSENFIVTAISNDANSSFMGSPIDIGGTTNIDEIILASRNDESLCGNIILKEIVVTELLTSMERTKVIERLTSIL